MKFQTNSLRRLSAICVVICALPFSGATQERRSPDANPPRVPRQNKKNIETFEAAWQIIRDTHFDTNFNGVDWPAVRTELRPRAAAARSANELRGILTEMLERLGQSHMSVIPVTVADAFDPRKVAQSDDHEALVGSGSSLAKKEGDVGLDVRLIGREIVVTRVEASGPARRAGVKPGWVVQAIGREPMADLIATLPPETDTRRVQFLAWRLVKASLTGRTGSTVRVEFLDQTNAPVTVDLQRQPINGEVVQFGLLPTLYAHLEHELVQSQLGEKVGVIRFNVWMPPLGLRFDRAIDEFRETDGIVIDLRGNIGGIGGMVMGFSGHFLHDKLSLGTMKTRGHELTFFANPRRVSVSGQRVEPYAGPLAILIDAVSLSTAEIFAGGMQDLRRARIFGETSGGQALPALWDRLPNGDVLYHAFADYVTGSGVRYETRGVIPDELTPLTRRDLIEGRDPSFSAALQWIHREKQKSRSAATGGK